MPKKGDIGICGEGCLGLIMHDDAQEVIYSDGNRGIAYVGVHLTNKIIPVGAEWSSRSPTVVGHVDDIETFMKYLRVERES